jgi:hypothetical protein
MLGGRDFFTRWIFPQAHCGPLCMVAARVTQFVKKAEELIGVVNGSLEVCACAALGMSLLTVWKPVDFAVLRLTVAPLNFTAAPQTLLQAVGLPPAHFLRMLHSIRFPVSAWFRCAVSALLCALASSPQRVCRLFFHAPLSWRSCRSRTLLC